jgi:hypothetical protein
VPYRPYPPNDPRQGPINAPYTQLLTIRFVERSVEIGGDCVSRIPWQLQASATFSARRE